MSEEKSFWTTLPGILTGLAMVISAISGLLFTLYTIGVFEPTKNEERTHSVEGVKTTIDKLTISREFLMGKAWQFSHGGGSVIAEEVRLLPDGRIDMGEYYHPNESRWGLDDNTLVFYHEGGEPSCRFTSVGIEHGKTVLSGPLLFDPSGATQHVLREGE